MSAYSCLILIVFALLVSGCGTDANEMSLTDESQDGTFYLKLDFPYEIVVDSSGKELRMPDGVPIVFESAAFSTQIEPLLTRHAPGSKAAKLVRVDANFRLQKEAVVIGVVQDPDGSAQDVSKIRWVVKTSKIRSADWCEL